MVLHGHFSLILKIADVNNDQYAYASKSALIMLCTKSKGYVLCKYMESATVSLNMRYINEFISDISSVPWNQSSMVSLV